MTTEPDTVYLPAELRDFAPPCDVEVALGFSPRWSIRVRRCRRKGAWTALVPCCGQGGVACDKHRWDNRPFACTICRTLLHAHQITWRKL